MTLSHDGPGTPKLDNSSGIVQSGCHPLPNSLLPCQWSMAPNICNATAGNGLMGEIWLWKCQSEQTGVIGAAVKNAEPRREVASSIPTSPGEYYDCEGVCAAKLLTSLDLA